MKKRWMIMAGLVALGGMAQAAFVTIGHAGNSADTTGYGAVGYTYQISATEVTIAEFQASGAGNGNENYWNDGVHGSVGPNAPASYVSLYEAMQYCNWMTSGNINNGLYEDKGGGVWGAKFDRATVMAGSINYFAVPTEDEWYKAAYFKPDASGYSLYANGTGTAPVAGTDANYNKDSDRDSPWVVGTGKIEQNGTYNMMGNVWERMVEGSGSVIRGGSYGNNEGALRSSDRYNRGAGNAPADVSYTYGLRVVSIGAIPEPASVMMISLGGLVIAGYRRFYGLL